MVSRGNFCTKKPPVVKTTEHEKMENRSISVVFDYVNCFVYPLFSILWKPPVDKSVENVEKCGFSTGIPVFFTTGQAVENFAYVSA